jgi:hypothetical protein
LKTERYLKPMKLSNNNVLLEWQTLGFTIFLKLHETAFPRNVRKRAVSNACQNLA